MALDLGFPPGQGEEAITVIHFDIHTGSGGAAAALVPMFRNSFRDMLTTPATLCLAIRDVETLCLLPPCYWLSLGRVWQKESIQRFFLCDVFLRERCG